MLDHFEPKGRIITGVLGMLIRSAVGYSLVLLLSCGGCQQYVMVTDTRTGEKYATKHPAQITMNRWSESDPARFHDDIRDLDVSIDAFRAEYVSKAAYEDLKAGRGAK